MKELLENAKEFLESGEDNLKKKRYNASVSDFFKAIATFCDYILYTRIKILPKNHAERFGLLKKYQQEIFNKTFGLFKKYRESYNLRLSKEDALDLKKYSHELRNIALSKK